MVNRIEVLSSLGVSRETSAMLDAYVDLLSKWQRSINLVSPKSMEDLWRRHILDCGQLVGLAPRYARNWVDLGAGAGLPGLVVAILLKESGDHSRVTLIEANGKKAAFLKEAIRLTGVRAQVIQGRIEDAVNSGIPCDIVTARALAPMQELLRLSSTLFMNGAQGYFLKGQDVEAELTDSAKSWKMQVQLLRSLSDPNGRIVHVTALSKRAPD
jgi:16S rRNA (guanine527-N7)-methyltransferase